MNLNQTVRNNMQNIAMLRSILNPLILLLWMLSASCYESINQELSAPNVVLIISDDQGWGDLSLHGNINIKTLNMDSLAIKDASFTNFYVSPVCSPTRAESADRHV